ncbi:MAG: DUF4294 domain-containing protein [Saprospiraceae bacterium]
MRYFLLFLAFIATIFNLQAQQQVYTTLNGKVYPAIIDDCGDTVIVAELQDVSISSPRTFDNSEDYKKYQRYRRAAVIVYPYAVEAIKVFRQLEQETSDMRKGKRKKYAKNLQKDMKEKFEDPLKKLTRTQGLVLTKMIEKELNTSTYELIKELRGGLTARYWSTMGGFYGYKLKRGYEEGEDAILDMVLDDFDVSYTIAKQ